MFYLEVFVITFVFSVGFTFFVKKLATMLSVIDVPDETRKLHRVATPLMGGLAIFLAFFTVLFLLREQLLAGDLEMKHWIGFFLGALVLMIGGYLDDKYNL